MQVAILEVTASKEFSSSWKRLSQLTEKRAQETMLSTRINCAAAHENFEKNYGNVMLQSHIIFERG